MRKNSQRGFTLIELMIVISIIAILSSVIIPNAVKLKHQAKVVACDLDKYNLMVALEMYTIDNGGHYPRDLRKLVPDYIREIPRCPEAGVDYFTMGYKTDVAANYYFLKCRAGHESHLMPVAWDPQFKDLEEEAPLVQTAAATKGEVSQGVVQAGFIPEGKKGGVPVSVVLSTMYVGALFVVSRFLPLPS